VVMKVGRRLRRQRTAAGRLTFEGVLVVAGAAGVGLVSGVVSSRIAIAREQVIDVLALLATGAGAAAVGLGQTAGRLVGNRRAAWLLPALALYCAVVVPGPMLMADGAEASALPRPGMVVACVAIVVLLGAAIRPPGRSSPRVGWIWAAVWASVALFLDLTAAAHPMSLPATATPLVMNVIVLVGWMSVSTAVVVAGYRVRSAPLWRLGLGFGVIAVAHLYRVVRPQPLVEPSLVFGALRVLGVVVVLFGMAQLLRRALTLVIDERFAHQEDLRLATLQADELIRTAAERDHELRNGLSGLSGMTQLLGDGGADERGRRAREAVVHELERMRRMLDGGRDHSVAVTIFDAAPVVRELVALWTVAGLSVEATVPSDLTVLGRPATLAQVLTNLLTNCSRHAPGGHVQVVARSGEQFVAVQVRDSGPASGSVPVPRAAGRGFGLQISRRLLEAEGGGLRAAPREPDGTGFTATIAFRAAPSAAAVPTVSRGDAPAAAPAVAS
jgi:two-component system, OmpR family, sensor kinase